MSNLLTNISIFHKIIFKNEWLMYGLRAYINRTHIITIIMYQTWPFPSNNSYSISIYSIICNANTYSYIITKSFIIRTIKHYQEQNSNLGIYSWLRGKWAFATNLQTMQQNVFVLKLFNKIELQVELNNSNVEFYTYFAT